MTCKYSKFPRCSRWLVQVFLGLIPLAAQAQQTTPVPAPSATPRPALGYVRFWNMLPENFPTLELLSASDKVLATATPYNYGAPYNIVPPGTYTFVIRKPGDENNPLKKFPVLLRADTYITFLASEKNGQPTVELIDDTPDPKKADQPARLIVRQFMPKASMIVASKDAAASSQEISYGEATTLDNLPRRILLFTTRATGLGPTPKQWSLEADFTSSRMATVLSIPDNYGRFRPRLVLDGPVIIPPPPSTPTR